MKSWYVGLILALTVMVLAGCGGGPASPAMVDVDSKETSTSTALDTSYPDALDVSGQLALGTMRLEGTEQGVTLEQAAALLPLWQAIQGGVLQSDAETNAVLAQIEGQMTLEQLAAIAAMQLTQESLQAWAQEQGMGLGGGRGMLTGGSSGPPAEFPEGEMAPEMAARRAEFENMSEEERAALRETMQAAGGLGGSGTGGSPLQSLSLFGPLIELLSGRAADGVDRSADAGDLHPTATPSPTSTPSPTPMPTDKVTPTAAPTVTETVALAVTLTETPAVEASVHLPAQTASADPPAVPAEPSVALTRMPDTDPAPPLTILVDEIRIQENGYYKMTGRVRNDGSEAYEGVGVHASFLDDDGNDYGHGPVDVYCPCLFLEPGAECPFSLEIYPRDYVAYHLHPLGQPADFFQWHGGVSLALGNISVSNDGIGNVRITGVVVNEHEFAVQNTTVAGALVNGSGQVVSVGSTKVIGDIEPGGSVSFDLRIPYEPYSHYQLNAQATRN